MNFDLHLPLGRIFALFSAMLTTHGLRADAAIYKNRSAAISTAAGAACSSFFGVTMLGFALRARSGAVESLHCPIGSHP